MPVVYGGPGVLFSVSAVVLPDNLVRGDQF